MRVSQLAIIGIFAALAACSIDTATFKPLEDCATAGDEDGNGMADCDDPACADTPACPPVCRNGKLERGEGCDDGNQVSGDGCDNNCMVTGCGNKVVADGEACDDGNQVSGDGCDNNCTFTRCGNKVVTDGEACDDGNLVDDDGCDSNCTVTGCGNYVVTAGEECDDGDRDDGDGCDSNCTVTGCGNHVVTMGEACDLGTQNSDTGECLLSCHVAMCSDGHVHAGVEQCDDGNLTPGDGCSATCVVEECGNGIRDPLEECDLGPQNSDTGECLLSCRVAVCGDGHVHAGVEQCDDGNLTPGDGCSATCVVEECGNGIRDPREECDLGPQNSDTGECLLSCRAAVCGDGHVHAGVEECDDGNVITEECTYGLPSCTVCDATCHPGPGIPLNCGDGKVQSGYEVCDDGNSTCGTCSADCQVLASAPATGSIRVVAPSSFYGTTQTFTLSDGINNSVTFEFTDTGTVSDPRFVPIDLRGLPNSAAAVRDVLIDAVNATPNLLITASAGSTGSTVGLTHDLPTALGNVAITETVSAPAFLATGMSGGAGGDCTTGQPCSSNEDCLSNQCQLNVCQ